MSRMQRRTVLKVIVPNITPRQAIELSKAENFQNLSEEARLSLAWSYKSGRFDQKTFRAKNRKLWRFMEQNGMCMYA